MATSVGGLSNLDVGSIVTQLMAVERQPLQAIAKTLSGIQTRLSAFGKLQSQLSAFQDAAKALTRASTWAATKASSSSETAVRATAGSDAVAGNYSIVVDHLAQRQAVASAALSGSDAVVGAGTLSIQLGTWNSAGGTFTADVDRPVVDVTLAAGSTLAQARDAINAADAGVTATLVDDGSGTRLMIRSDDTGASNAFRITATGDAGVTDLAFDPQAPGATGSSMTVEPRSAQAIVDGLTITSASNTLEGVIQGVTIDLRKGDPATTIDVQVETDTDALKAAVNKFVSTWNELNATITSQTKYDAATKTAGTLQGNSTIVSVQRQLRGIMQATVNDVTLQRLSDAGVHTQRDGSLSLDSTKFAAALATPEKLAALFSATGTGPEYAGDGIGRRFDRLLTSMLGVDGMITGATENLRDMQERTTDRQESFERRMTLVEERLRRQYTSLDAQLSQFGSASSLLTSRFG